MNHLSRTIAFVTMSLMGVSQAPAQETCLLYQRGTVECPGYGAPAATAVPGPSMDGGVATVPNAQSVTLFGGEVPPNGFMIRVSNSNSSAQVVTCFVNDNGPASLGGGFFVVNDLRFEAGVTSATFATPNGYKPIGPVSIWCQSGGYPVYLAARGW
jgi:hypothetical protein